MTALEAYLDGVGNQERGEKRFWSRINKTKTCWLWTGQLGGRHFKNDPEARYGLWESSVRGLLSEDG